MLFLLNEKGTSISLTKNSDGKPGNHHPPYGFLIDIGTPTVVVYLINLLTGEIDDQQGTYDKQAKSSLIMHLLHKVM